MCVSREEDDVDDGDGGDEGLSADGGSSGVDAYTNMKKGKSI